MLQIVKYLLPRVCVLCLNAEDATQPRCLHTHTQRQREGACFHFNTSSTSCPALCCKWKSILGDMRKARGHRYSNVSATPFSWFFPWFLSQERFRGGGVGWGCSHLLTLPLWCRPTSFPDGHLVGTLKFNADES